MHFWQKLTPQGCCTYPWSLRPRHPTEKPSRQHEEQHCPLILIMQLLGNSFSTFFMRLPCMVNLQLNVKLNRSTKTTGDQQHGTPPIGTSSVLSCHPKAPAFSCAWLGCDLFTLLYHVAPEAELPCDYFKGGSVALFYSATWQNNANRNHCPWSFEVAPRKIWSQKMWKHKATFCLHWTRASPSSKRWNLWTSRPAPAFVHPEWALCPCKCTNSRPPGSHKMGKTFHPCCKFPLISIRRIRVTCATVFLCFSASSFICSKHATVWRSLSCSVQGLPQWASVREKLPVLFSDTEQNKQSTNTSSPDDMSRY